MNIREMSSTEMREAILGLLRKCGVNTATITYSGSGDSGEIDGVKLDPESTAKFPIFRTHGVWGEDGFVDKTEIRETGIDDIVADWAYEIIREEWPGWELDYGSAGRIEIDVVTGKVNLSHEWYELRSITEGKEI